MSNDKLDRMLTLLAAAHITPAEFRTIVRGIQAATAGALDQRYARVRASVRRISETAGADEAVSATSSSHQRVLGDVLNFARDGAPNPRDAAARLSARLTQIDDQLVLPPFSVKEGFTRWLERVVRIASPNAVLNAAIAEFSSSLPTQSDGWRLSDL